MGLFLQNSPISSGSFAKDNLHLKASYGSSAPCTAICIWSVIFCKTALELVALLRKMTCNIRQPMGLRHRVQPFAFGVSLDFNLQPQLPWYLFCGTWLKRPGELDHRLRCENEEMTLRMRCALTCDYMIWHNEIRNIVWLHCELADCIAFKLHMMLNTSWYCTTCTTGGQRPIGCLKMQVNFRKRATNYRALLRRMTNKDNASYGSSAPCNMWLYDMKGLWLVCSLKTQFSFAEYSLFNEALLQERPVFVGSLIILATSYSTTHSATMSWQISPPKCIVENKDPCVKKTIQSYVKGIKHIHRHMRSQTDLHTHGMQPWFS